MKMIESVLDKKTVVGLSVATSNENELNPESALIPVLWQQFFSESITEKIQSKVNESELIGVYTDYDTDHRGHYSVIAGQEVLTADNLPDGLVSHEIPEGRYLVFSQNGEMPGIIYKLWEQIWGYFSEESNYRRAFTTDFELYNNDNPSKIEIYIAIEPA